MTLEQIKDYDFAKKNVLVIGCPASGKSFITDLLNNGTHKVFRTDTYIPHGYVGSLYALLEDVMNVIGRTWVEGVQGYRMLRKGAEMETYKPDIVIECEISRYKMEETYLKERDPAKIKYLRQFNASHQTILNGYYQLMEGKQLPVWLKWENNY